MGDLVPGDTLFDQDGNTCVVEFAHPVKYGLQCYRVEFSDGSSLVADSEHLWTVCDVSDDHVVMETQNIAGVIGGDGVHRLFVPVTRTPGGLLIDKREILSVVPVESVPVRCIQVSSPTGLFLAGKQYIPTHNTATHLFLLEEESSRFTRKYVAGYIAQTHAKVEERYQEWLARWEAAGLVLDTKNKDQFRYIKLRPWGMNKVGWEVFFWSGDPSSVDNLRGPRLDRICIDEAGFICSGVKAAVWPMGYGRNAKKLITGTPKRGGMGFEWFKEVYDRGMAGEAGYVSFNCPSESAPWNDPVVMMRERLALRSRLAPETKTVEEMEELDGVFVSSVGAVFENVDAVISIPIHRIEDDGTLFIGKDPEPGHLYIIGQDWGLIGDNSVSAVLDRHTKEQVALRVEPLNLDYDTQIAHLDQLHRRYNKAMIVGDGQGVGAYMGSTLLPKKYGAAYMDVKLTYGGVHDKGAYVTRMRRLFQSSEWKLMNVPALREQFVSFRSKPMGGNRNGLIYGAPEGSHDDIVLAVLYASIMLELTVPSPIVSAPPPGRFTYNGVTDALKRKRNADVRNRGNWMPGARA